MILYSRKLLGTKLSQTGRKYDFRGENFHRLFACATNRRHGPKFHEENFYESFLLYGIYG